MPITHGFQSFFTSPSRFRTAYAYELLLHNSKTSLSCSNLRYPQRFKTKTKRKVQSSTENDKQKHPPVYMRHTINSISNILRFSTWDSAQQQLQNLSVKWDSFTVNQVLKTHPPMEKAWLFFNWASCLSGFKHDHFTYTTMLDIFGEAGRISSMKHVYEEMLEKGIKIDAVTYTSMLHWLSKDGNVEEAFKVWEEMNVKGCKPTVVSYTAFIKVLFDNNRPKEATQVYKEMLEVGCPPNCHTYTVLIEYLAGIGKFEAALEVMSKMQDAGPHPDKATCNILVEKCSKAGDIKTLTETLLYMKENSLVLRRPIYLEALQALKIAGESNCLLQEVNPHLASEGIDKEASDAEAITENSHFYVDRGLVINLLARGNFVALDILLHEIISRDIYLDSDLISSVIHANCDSCRQHGALTAFKYSIQMDLELERAAYASLMGLFVRSNSFDNILEVMESMGKLGITPGMYLTALLIYKLGCAKLSDSSAKIFYSMPCEQNVVTYTALMDAYMRSGYVDKGIDLYRTMGSKGVHATSGTYKVLIAGLVKAGRIHETIFYRKKLMSMHRYGHNQDIVTAEESLCNFLFDGVQAS